MPAKKSKVTAKANGDKTAYALASVRIGLGLIFLWAFFDKLIGLGFTTCRNAKTDVVDIMCNGAWLQGGSPTTGFLKFGTKGPFADIFQNLAGNDFVDFLFMAGLLGIGIALLFGIAVKLGSMAGSLLLFMMWLAVLPPEHHPVLDDHIIYIMALMAINFSNGSQKWGLRDWWVKQDMVKNNPILE